MGGFDFKEIGLAAKDIVVGVVTAAAGVSGGPAAAAGVSKAGGGLDRIIEMAAPSDKKQTRGEQFDRSDFSTRKLPAAAASMIKPVQAEATGVAPVVELPADAQPTAAATGDGKITTDYLQSLGWSLQKIEQILSGPSTSAVDPLAAVIGREVSGTRVALMDGTRISTAPARAIPKTEGTSIDKVQGARVAEEIKGANSG